ncbi:MAG: ABC transporter permease [Planctomycetes bacterium]|nr:ABC transporter permease [Planctomycetota bacterium]
MTRIPVTPAEPRARRGSGPRRILGIGSVYLFVIVLLLVGRAIYGGFWSADNLVQVVKDVSILGIVAAGVSFVTMSGHFVDLSIPAIMACSGIVAVYALPAGFAVAMAAGLATGGALGLANGLMVGYLRLNPILWTLASMSLIDGITRWAYGGKWIYAKPTPAGAAFAGLYHGEWFGFLPVAVALFAGVGLAGHVLMHETGFGRRLKLTGAAYEIARLSGVDVRRTVMWTFLVSGIASALAGMIKTSFNRYGDVDIGLAYDFQAITAVVIGGVTLAGGRGTMAGVIGGVVVIGLLGRILPLIPGIGQDEQFIIRGLVFIAAVGLNLYALRRAGRSDA